ncbi:stage II sporulation protein P [Dethiobacter alkaliphilus]|uniref:stage II sporulation protein P n=1 Tax=Dethiobacter alkaliphilus TaxID=427926 RepID=UPI002227F0FE|nr:stage II sporulation protein P [Dethiobacter alkaliphilus]MCW3490551.1 stage II sporulation protein P [Dethiobacter alkaliphilus]
MRRFAFLAIFLLSILIAMSATSPRATLTARSLLDYFDNRETGEISREDLLAELYYTMVDEKGKEILITGRIIHVGDEYITSDNRLYRVYRVEGRTAYARFIREVGAFFEEDPSDILVMLRERLGSWGAVPVQTEEQEEGDNLEPEAEPQRLIGIYHTHNAESFIPSDGTDSIYGEGGIHDVGESFRQALEEKNIRVMHDETLHLPHDRGAYRRSRVTAEQLLEEGPDVMFDIHRDGAPAAAYAAEIEGESVTQVQFVVGRQNANMNVTRQFALDLKNTADEIHPGLVKGIFMARGNYNQDLTPMNLLLEVGAHQNSREDAEDGAALFADVVSYYFYGDVDNALEEEEEAAPAPATQPPPDQPGPGDAPTPPGTQGVEDAASQQIFRLLGITLAIIVGFMLLNAGSIEDIHVKLVPYMEKLQPYTQQGDRFLAGLQEKIHALALRAKIPEAATALGAALQAAGREGDRILVYWQERIHEAALTIKERAIILYNQLTNRNKLR